MTRGFIDVEEFQPIMGWNLHQVSIDKYHVMFWFEGGHALLMVANAFSFRSADGSLNYTYRIRESSNASTNQTALDVNRILRTEVSEIRIASPRELELIFTHGDTLVIHDDPETKSWWFYAYQTDETIPVNAPLKWHISDIESDADI